MSITTSTSCTPNRMRIIYEFVKSRGDRGISRDVLISYITPKSIGASDSNLITHTIAETQRLGFINAGKDETFFVGEDLKDSDRSFLDILEQRLLRPSSSDEYGHAKFQQALSWLLMQSPITPLDWGSNPRERIERQCGESSGVFELTNNTRFQNFAYWARFLGFARFTTVSGTMRITPDPTEAIRRHLPHLLSGNEATAPLPIVQALSSRLPVLDYGTVRVEVEKLAQENSSWETSPVSATTTLALMRMEQAGEISLDNRADSGSRIQLSPLTSLPARTVISEIKAAS